MDKKRPHQDQLKSLSEPAQGSAEIDDVLCQLVRLLAKQAARDWHSRTIPFLSHKEPKDGLITSPSTSDH
jgi:hypothetical protein